MLSFLLLHLDYFMLYPALCFLCIFLPFIAVTDPELRKLSKLFVEMPTEEFLARLVKSRAPRASVVVINNVVETGPEAASWGVVTSFGVAQVADPDMNVVLVKDKEKKRHRDGTTSRSHHHKKLKEPLVCPSSDGVSLASKSGVESRSRVITEVDTIVDSVGGGLRLCKGYADKVYFTPLFLHFVITRYFFYLCLNSFLSYSCYCQLSGELQKLLYLDEVFGIHEVKRLRGEVCDLKEENLELKKSSEGLAREKDSSDQKVFNLLAEKSELITECDSLGASVKDLKLKIANLKVAANVIKEEYVGMENSWIAAKADLVSKLDDLGAQLARCQAESLKSFEEGYEECYTRLAGVGIDVNSHTFDCYLADLQGKVENGGTGSSNHPIENVAP